MRLGLLLAVLALTPFLGYSAEVTLDSLKKGDVVRDFRVESLYLGAADEPIGARFIHQRSGFTLDYLRIESVPQGYTWVNSIPVGDQGEPHTQEHLLLGKGTTGRRFASLDTMWLSSSTAFTQQWRTSYHFSTSAGPDVFFDLFAAELNALLHPNYTDEEIRREVRHFGVTTTADGSLRLEEKGSVYNEMTSSSANRYRVLFRAFEQLAYGTAHPLSWNSGGEPSGIRTMKPEDIRNFHAANYYLANMGTMVAFPSSGPLSEVLARTDTILDGVEGEPAKRPSTLSTPMPSPDSAPAGTISVAEYPHRNDQQPSPIVLAWPPSRNLGAEDFILLGLFADAFAGDPTTNVYKLLVDSQSRVMDTGATAVFNQVSEDPGNLLAIFLDNVAAANLTREKIAEIRKIVTGELARIAVLEDGSPALKEFNDRVLSRVTELEREGAEFVNSPPGWGGRGTGSSWLDQLSLLEKTPEFRKSVTLGPQLASIRQRLGSGANPWRELLPRWEITNVVPYGVAARPSPALIEREEKQRLERADAEAARLAAAYGMESAQEAIRRYQADYEEASARIEAEATKISPPEFVKTPPLTLDDTLDYRATKLQSGVPIVISTFDNMSSATLGLALRADGVPEPRLRYLSLLPDLLTRVGVIDDGVPVPYEEMSERLRKEILDLDASFLTNPRTGRVELGVRAGGIGATEATRAIEWIELVTAHPDWRPENLPRIRDVVDQSLGNLRNVMQAPEEYWVNNPANAYRMQTSPAYLAADSFLTRSHNALRLRWLLNEAPAEDHERIVAAFDALAGAAKGKTREQLKIGLSAADDDARPALGFPSLPSGLSERSRALLGEARKDLDLTLIEIPDDSLERDWVYLVRAMRDDLLTPPATTLEALHQLRRELMRRDGARMSLVASSANQKAILPAIETLSASLAAGTAPRATRSASPRIDARLRQRLPDAKDAVYTALLAPNMTGGVIITSVPSVHFADSSDRDRQLDYLTARLFSGYGAHGIFLKTLAAGLAYSNGIRASVQSGRVGYYAERTPEIPQTVSFVVESIRGAALDPRLGDYAVAQVFGENRAAATYEARAEGIANDLADGQLPDQVRKFRASILELRKDPKLAERLFARKDAVHARILPGYAKGTEVPDGIFFAIGPDKQLDAWERYLETTEGEAAKLWRLYPRDFWMP